MNRLDHFKGWMIAGIVFVLASILCFLSYQWIGSSIDGNGILHEPFALIPIGHLSALIGSVCLAVGGIQKQRNLKRS